MLGLILLSPLSHVLRNVSPAYLITFWKQFLSNQSSTMHMVLASLRKPSLTLPSLVSILYSRKEKSRCDSLKDNRNPPKTSWPRLWPCKGFPTGKKNASLHLPYFFFFFFGGKKNEIYQQLGGGERSTLKWHTLLLICSTPSPSWTIRPLPIFPKGGQSLEDASLLWPLLPGEAIKATLFYFTQNSVSVFQFGTREQSPGFRQHWDTQNETTWSGRCFCTGLEMV